VGCIAFSPLAQGLLTDRYLRGVPEDSRAARPGTFLKRADLTEEKLAIARRLNEVALERGQSLAQMALAWALRLPEMTSVVIGASRAGQIEEAAGTLKKLEFSPKELAAIDRILAGSEG
jgi:L-glyceraldehyde 3-phosphate reductase